MLKRQGVMHVCIMYYHMESVLISHYILMGTVFYVCSEDFTVNLTSCSECVRLLHR